MVLLKKLEKIINFAQISGNEFFGQKVTVKTGFSL